MIIWYRSNEKRFPCRAIASLDLYVLRFSMFGKEFPKQHNCSPDAFIQLAIQLSFYK